MAERRMFAKSIVLSDAFLDMPMSARCLYFTLGMLADDDGFCGSAKSVMRQCGASQDDMALLLAKRYVIGFESGVIVIKHWRMNNYLRNDRYKSTDYTEEKDKLIIKENGSYTEKKEAGIPTVYQMDTNGIPSIGKDSIGKDSIGYIYSSSKSSQNESQKNDREKWFDEFWGLYPRKIEKKKAHDKFLKICKDELTYNTILVGLKKTIIPKAEAEGTDFIPYPTTWLNGERWNDEPYQPKQRQKKGDWNFTDF